MRLKTAKKVETKMLTKKIETKLPNFSDVP